MNTLKETIEKLLAQALHAIDTATTLEALEQIRITFLSRNGSLAQATKELGTLSVEEKRVVGPLLQSSKNTITEKHEEKVQFITQQMQKQKNQKKKLFDVTASLYRPVHGSLHVYTKILEEIEDIFTSMGYELVDGPEIETEFNNFTALNIPADHPARELQDTFWLTLPGMLMRTQTSSVQIREMQKRTPPFAIFSPGRVYRNEETDASHDFLFTQTECMYVGPIASVSQLLGTIQAMLKALFNTDQLSIRVRPGYFPFVEPGLEVDMSCPFCKTGCSVCKKTGWIELLGSGLVHPNVLRAGQIDDTKYSGFAFGFGVERIAMIKYGINDIRLFHSSVIPFLEQF